MFPRLEQRVGLVGLRESEAVRIDQRLELAGIGQLGGLPQDLAVETYRQRADVAICYVYAFKSRR